MGPKPELGKHWEIKVHFTNTGKTPAKDVRPTCNFSYTKQEGDLPEQVLPKTPTLIAPNDDSICVLQPLTVSLVTKDILDELSQGFSPVFVYGYVEYYDIFGKSRWLIFCRSMSPDGNSWNACQMKGANDTGDGKRPPNPETH